jgi:hypothetical protein
MLIIIILIVIMPNVTCSYGNADYLNTDCYYAKCHPIIMLNIVILSVIMLCATFSYRNADYHYTECHYA